MDGTAIKEIFYLIPKEPFGGTTPTIPLPKLRSFECCDTKSWKVLADINSPDEFTNDVTSFHWWMDDVVDSATMILTKFSEDLGDYDEIATLNNNDLGAYYSLGSYVNGFNEKFIGYQLEWRKVLIAHGSGSYKIKLNASSAIGNTGQLISDEYCMKQYTPERANGTVKIEYYLNGIFGKNDNDYGRRDYSDKTKGLINWYNSLRLNGIFSYVKSTYQDDYTRYNNGSRQWVKSEQEPEYKLILKPHNWKVHEIMRTDVLQADEILITDYNSKNFAKWIQKSVQKTSEYPPKFHLNQSQNASVELTFRQAINNNKRSRC